jgi:hypothetical protein
MLAASKELVAKWRNAAGFQPAASLSDSDKGKALGGYLVVRPKRRTGDSSRSLPAVQERRMS